LVSFGCPLWPEASPSSVTGTAPFLSSFGGGSSNLQVILVSPSGLPASKEFGFPPSLAPELIFSAALAPSTAPVFKFTPLRSLHIPQPCFAPLSLVGAAVLGEKLRSPLPVVVSKPF
jgi:hypothetical protein